MIEIGQKNSTKYRYQNSFKAILSCEPSTIDDIYSCDIECIVYQNTFSTQKEALQNSIGFYVGQLIDCRINSFIETAIVCIQYYE